MIPKYRSDGSVALSKDGREGEGKSSIGGASFNFINSIVGSGIIGWFVSDLSDVLGCLIKVLVKVQVSLNDAEGTVILLWPHLAFMNSML